MKRSHVIETVALCTLLGAFSASTAGCAATHDTTETGDGDVGGMRIALKSQAQNGHQYNLRNAVFTITASDGSQTVLDSSSGDVLQAPLSGGAYSVTLSGPYALDEVQPDNSTVRVAATLASAPTQQFNVNPPNITDVSFVFVVSSMDVQFGLGGVNLGFTVAHCNPGDIRYVACSTGGSRTDSCVNDQWQQGTGCFEYKGEGECVQKNGSYGLDFRAVYDELTPHTAGTNAQQAEARCKATCAQYGAWCYAAQLMVTSYAPTPECWLVTDRATFEASGQTLQNNFWGGAQTIDGKVYQTYCAGNGDCSQTSWGGGSLSPREGFRCFMLQK